MNSNRNKWPGLIAVEGIDGAGTTTLTRNIGKVLTERGVSHATGFEPTDGEIGRLIRKALTGLTILSPESLALLFAADRREHIYGKEGIQKTVENDGLYITDRYLFSSLAYQSMYTDWDWVNNLNSSYPLPGYLIYLSIPVKDAMGRLSEREHKDIYEIEEIQDGVLAAYERSINHYADSGISILRLDSRCSPHELLDRSISFLSELF